MVRLVSDCRSAAEIFEDRVPASVSVMVFCAHVAAAKIKAAAKAICLFFIRLLFLWIIIDTKIQNKTLKTEIYSQFIFFK